MFRPDPHHAAFIGLALALLALGLSLAALGAAVAALGLLGVIA